MQNNNSENSSAVVASDPNVTDVYHAPQNQINDPLPPSPVQTRPNKKSPKKLLFTLLTLLIIVGISLFSFLTYAIAYEKIDIGNEAFQTKISDIVLSIPFVPKTPRYVLTKTLIAHGDINSHSFDASVSVASENLISELGLNSFDIKLVGDVDYSNSQEINFNIDADVTNDFRTLLRKQGQNVYIKIEKLPNALLALFGINISNLDPVLENWIVYDIKPLDSEARKLIENSNEGGSYTNKITKSVVNALMEKEILASMSISSENYEGEDVYLLSYSPSGEEINHLYRQLDRAIDNPDIVDVDETEFTDFSKIITKLEVILRVAKKDNLLRWASVETEINSNDDVRYLNYLLTPYIQKDQKFNIAFVMKMSNFNEEVNIKVPEKSISVEEFISKIYEALGQNDSSNNKYELNEEQIKKLVMPSVTDHIRGNLGSEIIVIEYADLQDPFSDRHHDTLKKIYKDYGGKLAWIFRHYPLESIHPQAKPAAITSECVAEIGGEDLFWQYIDSIYESNYLNESGVSDLATQLGINKSMLDDCVNSGKYLKKVETSFQSGITAGVTGTPSNFVVFENGKVISLPGAVPESTILNELEPKDSSSPSSGIGIFSFLNPGRQFAQTRDVQRQSDLLQITNAIYQFAAEHDGNLPDTDGDDTRSNFPTEQTCIGTGPGCFDLASAGSAKGDPIVPTYIAKIPEDPTVGIEADTGYDIYIDTKTGRIVASAPAAELKDKIKIER